MTILEAFKRKIPDETEWIPVVNQFPKESQQGPGKKRKTPQDESQRKRNGQVKIRLTQEEISRLKEAAAAAGMSMADFILAGIEQQRVIKVPGAARLRLEVIRCRHNLNQANRLGNTANKEGASVDIESILEASKKLGDVLEQLGGFISKWDADITEEIENERR